MDPLNMRIGHGYDVHRFAEQFDEGQPLILAGVKLQERLSLLAHSDGDLVLHAICDALLGAMGKGDIGQHFPDTDAEFAGISSGKLLAKVIDLATSSNMRVVNLDVTVIAQLPKLSPHRSAMVKSIAALLHIDEGRVNLKATTTEGLGPFGRKEGMACHAVILLAGND
jgi:2-C-methyl-D-erythritol 2,4-cyclodiphosphate synthase